MKLGLMINVWGDVVAHPAAATSVRESYYLTPCDLPSVVAFAKAAGYDYLEMFDGTVMEYRNKPQELSDLLDAHDITLGAVYTGGTFVFSEVVSEDLKKIETVCQVASTHGATYLVIGGGAVMETDRIQLISKMASVLDEADRIATDHGLTALYHPHLGSIVETSDEIDAIMENSRIKLCPDTGHIHAGGSDVVDVVRRHLDRVPYVHLKDVAEGRFCPPGDGEIDFPALLEVLGSDGKHRDLAVEIDGYSGQPELGVIKAYTQVRKLVQ